MGAEAGATECFSKAMASMPGFRFHPTDEELVMYYLKRKICGKRLKLDVILETDVYKWDPEELPGLSVLRTGDRQWFFFCHRDRKYPNGARSNRATRQGYWKATGKDRNVTCNSRSVGVKKTLVFYRGRAPNGERTDWVMHEYTMDEEELNRCQGIKDYFALYKLYKKSGPGPKNGEQYGAPFKEEEWADDECVDFNINSADRELANTVPVNDQLRPLADDEVTDMINQILDDELALDQQFGDSLLEFPQVVSEETRSAVVDQFSEAVTFHEANGIFPSTSQRYDVQSVDLNQSASHLQGSEVVSTPNLQVEDYNFQEDDFLEINDLDGSELTLSNMETPVENLQFEDGLSELDLFQDAEMFLCDLGPINEETIPHSYMNNASGSNIENQNYHLLHNPEDATQNVNEFWMHDERNILSPFEGFDGSFSQQNPGAVCDSASFPTTEGYDNQSSTAEDVATSRFSSALWSFVESIPTTPASAAENALVNRALNRMSSFSRVKINIKPTNTAAGKDTATTKRVGRKGFSFLFFPILIALCAFLWISLGTFRLLGRCVAP
ncbi:hypothetical protein PIB30_117634 [Stylosanthes scabra]|uniref:NAC domain-containing protein n=1 Tax=Stylosanthes scabra TaxID=79078 RepID=A0ABU6QFE2_9FABA|nr:hypothetical protein [Stylosanthes scabra]